MNVKRKKEITEEEQSLLIALCMKIQPKLYQGQYYKANTTTIIATHTTIAFGLLVCSSKETLQETSFFHFTGPE